MSVCIASEKNINWQWLCKATSLTTINVPVSLIVAQRLNKLHFQFVTPAIPRLAAGILQCAGLWGSVCLGLVGWLVRWLVFVSVIVVFIMIVIIIIKCFHDLNILFFTFSHIRKSFVWILLWSVVCLCLDSGTIATLVFKHWQLQTEHPANWMALN